MLSLPFVLREASFVPGLLVIVVVCSAAMASFYMLACCCELSGGHTDYRRIGTAAFGPFMGTAIQATVLCYTSMSCISFCVLLGDLVPAIVAAATGQSGIVYTLLGNRHTVLPVIGVFILLPMSCLRDLRNFQHSSAVALGCDAIAAGSIILHFLLPSADPPRYAAQISETVDWVSLQMVALTTTPIVVVAANCHYNAPR